MPAGRPIKYTAALGAQLIAIMSEGFSITAAAAELGFARETIYAWAEKYPEFSDALKLGRGKRVSRLERDMLGATEGPVVTARIFALKNACPEEWREKVVQEHTGANGDAIKIETNDIDVARRIAFALAKGAAATDGSK